MDLWNIVHDIESDVWKITAVEGAYEKSREAMKSAADQLHGFAQNVAMDDDQRKRLDGIHKAMRRLMREWNKLQQVTGREGAPTLPDEAQETSHGD